LKNQFCSTRGMAFYYLMFPVEILVLKLVFLLIVFNVQIPS